MHMRVLVTRPQREAQKLVDALASLGFVAMAMPLIAVIGPPEPQALVQVWNRLTGFDAVMFVSGNAVEHFFASRPDDSLFFTSRSPKALRAFVTGPGSQSALRKAGVAAQWVDAPHAQEDQFDSEALWKVVQAQVKSGFRLLIVRGAESNDPAQSAGRDWLASRVMEAGGEVEFVVAYQRQLPTWTAERGALAAQAASDGSIWLFSSSQAIRNLAALCPDQTWSQARAIVTHSRIAHTALALGFGDVLESRPSIPALVASIESRQ